MAVVLLIEDNDRFANAVSRSLTGHEVVRSASVHGAISILQSRAVDCALIDLNLTDFDDNDGAEILSYMRLNFPTIPRAVVTGSRLRGSIYKNMMQRYGVSEVVVKGDVEREGFGTRDLIDVVHTLLGSGVSAERSQAINELQGLVVSTKKSLQSRVAALEDARRFGLRGRGRAAGTRRAQMTASIDALTQMYDRVVVELSTCQGAEVGSVADRLRDEIAEVAKDA